MKYIITILILFCTLQSIGQKVKNDSFVWANSGVSSDIGEGYGQHVFMWRNSGLEVRGDSLTAIKELISALNRKDSLYMAEQIRQEKRYRKLIDAVIADQKYKQKIWNDLQNSLKKIK